MTKRSRKITNFLTKANNPARMLQICIKTVAGRHLKNFNGQQGETRDSDVQYLQFCVCLSISWSPLCSFVFVNDRVGKLYRRTRPLSRRILRRWSWPLTAIITRLSKFCWTEEPNFRPRTTSGLFLFFLLYPKIHSIPPGLAGSLLKSHHEGHFFSLRRHIDSWQWLRLSAFFHFSLPPVVALPARRLSLLHNSCDSFSFKISRTTGIFSRSAA